MIVCDVEGYCENCTNFNAEVERPYAIHSTDGACAELGDTVIRCSQRKICATIANYIKEEIGKENKNEQY